MRGGKKQFARDEGYNDYSPPRNSKGAMRNGQQANPVWEQGIMSYIEQQQYAESKRRASEYTFSKPWDQHPADAADEFQRQVETLNYEVTAPWVDPPVDEVAELNRKLRAISSYEYKPLWQPIEQTVQRKQQLSEYKLNPPFQTKSTGPGDPGKPAKKTIPGYNAKTLAPWEHGAQAPDIGPMKAQFDTPHTGFWSVPETPEALIESSGDPVLDNLRLQLKRHGANGILGLARKFRIMDDNDSGSLDMSEFSKAMRECNLADLSKRAIEHLFRYFDSDDSGSVSYDEFLVGIRGVMTARRRALVQQAFDVLDKDRSGIVDLEDIRGVYNVSHHPDFIQGKKTQDEILADFMSNFEGPRGNRDGIVTDKEFENYYSNISASVDDDDYFELMIRNAWHISGGSGACANSTNRRVLVTHADGTQTVEEIKNDIGVKKGDSAEMTRRLQAQGVVPADIATQGGYDSTQGRGGRGSGPTLQPRSLAELHLQRASSHSPRGGSQTPTLSAQGRAGYAPQVGGDRGGMSTRGSGYGPSGGRIGGPIIGGTPRGITPQSQSCGGDTPRTRPKSLSEHLEYRR